MFQVAICFAETAEACIRKGIAAPFMVVLVCGLSMPSLSATYEATQISALEQLLPCSGLRGNDVSEGDNAGDKG